MMIHIFANERSRLARLILDLDYSSSYQAALAVKASSGISPISSDVRFQCAGFLQGNILNVGGSGREPRVIGLTLVERA